MLAMLLTLAAGALQAPSGMHEPSQRLTASVSSRRAILAAPLVAASCGVPAANAFNPLDVVFGWIPEVGCSSGDKSCGDAATTTDKTGKPPEISTAEKIRRRRLELEQQEQARLSAEYSKNQNNRAASRAMDASGR